MLFLIIVGLNVIYLLFNLILFYGWKNLPKVDMRPDLNTKVSIIIVVRNEEKNIRHLLKDLEKQQYSKELYEVLVVNDHSEDSTSEIVENFRKSKPFNLSLLHLHERTMAPKKSAINLAVQKSTGQLILITDGDCRMGVDWVDSMVQVYESKRARFISGPVTFAVQAGFTQKILMVEFSSLIGAGAAMISFNKPVMCNAANLAFDKSTFVEVGGFSGNEDSASGDDVFLMRKIFNKYPESVFFNKNKEAIVSTSPESSLKKFYYQRIRWAGKWRKVSGVESRIVPVFVFIIHLSFLATLVLLVLGKFSPVAVAIVFLARFSGEYLFLRNIMKFSGRKASIVHYFVASLAYPFYAVFIGLAANFSGYYWKGRRYAF